MDYEQAVTVFAGIALCDEHLHRALTLRGYPTFTERLESMERHPTRLEDHRG